MSEKKENSTPNQELPKPKSAQISFHIMGIKFDSWEEAVAILKNDHEFTMESMKEFFQIFLQDWEEPYQPFIPRWSDEDLIKNVESIKPITVQEAFTKYHKNAEQLMRVLSYIDPEEIVNNMKAEIVDEETLTKVQKRTVIKKEFEKNDMKEALTEEMFETKEISYKDTYKLYKIGKEELKLEDDAYVVGCDCTTTGRKYYLFVEEEFAKSAIGAIASTMRDANGVRLDREGYLKIEAES